jgi:hypothetical protein
LLAAGVYNGVVASAELYDPGTPIDSLGAARIWIGLKNSDDVGIRFDLRAETYLNGTQLIGSGELPSAAGGSSGFNNAHLYAVPQTLIGSPSFGSGDTLSIKVLVRNACTGSGKNSGTARLWYNEVGAASGFDATIASPETYYLRSGSALTTTPGTSPRLSADSAAGAKCSAYKTFGTWTVVPVP